MARSKGIENITADLNGNLQNDFNTFIRAALFDLSNQSATKYSPVDTGFFASSWTASTQRPRPDEARESVAPWSNIKPTRRGQRSSQAKVEPRFINSIPNFKPFSKVFIGNRSEYAASALGSPRSRVAKYSGTLRPLVNEIFSDKKVKIGIGTKPFKGGQGGIGPFADPDKTFVDYTNL